MCVIPDSCSCFLFTPLTSEGKEEARTHGPSGAPSNHWDWCWVPGKRPRLLGGLEKILSSGYVSLTAASFRSHLHF